MPDTPQRVRRQQFGKYFLPTRSVNTLVNMGITPGIIDRYPTSQIATWDGLGDEALKEIRRVRQSATVVKPPKPALPVRATVEDPFDESDVATGHALPVEDPFDEEPAPKPKKRSAPTAVQPRDLSDPMDAARKRAVTQKVIPANNRLKLDIGEELGFRGKHAQWMNDVVRNAPAELAVDSIERLVVKLIASAYALDPTKGGTLGVMGPGGEFIKNIEIRTQ